VSARRSHQELENLLPAAALDILEPSDAERVLRHVRSCSGCSLLLHEYREAAGSVGLALPERPLSDESRAAIQERLMARVRGGAPEVGLPAGTIGPSDGRSYKRRDWWTVWSGWMVAAGLAGLLLVHHAIHRPVAYGWLVAGILSFLVLGLAVHARRQQTKLNRLRDQLAAAAGENGRAAEGPPLSSGPRSRSR
jgi:Putative zinc-finger